MKLDLFRKEERLDSSLNSTAVRTVNTGATGQGGGPVQSSFSADLADIKKNIQSLQVAVERLNAENAGSKEMRLIFNDRFSKISESIGELHSLLKTGERNFAVVEAKAEKTAGLVEAVQPQNLLSSVNKVDFKIEALKAKVEANDLVYNKIRDDVRDLRNKFVIFRNVELIKELNEDSKTRFRELKKIEFEIVKRSDRVDSLFGEIQNTIKVSKENAKSISDLSESINKVFISSDKLRTDLGLKVSKDDVGKLQSSVDKALQSFKEESDKVNSALVSIKTEIMSGLSKDYELYKQSSLKALDAFYREEFVKMSAASKLSQENMKKEIMVFVERDFEDYKKRALRDIEISIKKEELQLVHQLVEADMKKAGLDFEKLAKNAAVTNMLVFMNVSLLNKVYDLNETKLSRMKGDSLIFALSAYVAMALEEKSSTLIRKELVAAGFDGVKCERILNNGKVLKYYFNTKNRKR